MVDFLVSGPLVLNEMVDFFVSAPLVLNEMVDFFVSDPRSLMKWSISLCPPPLLRQL